MVNAVLFFYNRFHPSRLDFFPVKKRCYQLISRHLLPETLYTATQEEEVVGWLVGCFGLNGPLRQYFSLYRAVSQREGERKEK